MRFIKPLLKLAVVASLSSAASVSATSAQQMLESYRQQARAEQADFVEFSSDRGRLFLTTRTPTTGVVPPVTRPTPQPPVDTIAPPRPSSHWPQLPTANALHQLKRPRSGLDAIVKMCWSASAPPARRAT